MNAVVTENEALLWLATVFGEKPENIRPEMRRDELPNWDSIGAISLMADLDEKYGILLDEKELEGLRQISDIIRVLREHKKLQD